MNENLIQALNTYTTSLEQQLAALETRVAQLEELLATVKEQNELANTQISTLQAEIAGLAAGNVVAHATTEPEVEIELILDEESEEVQPTEPIAVETEEEVVETPTPQETTPVVEVKEEVEEVKPVAEVKQEVKPVVKPVAQPVAPGVPTQTSLFGPNVTDIRQAISLGDRFLFQRELFAGNGEQMQQALDDINELYTLEEAINYIKENFNWDSESTAAALFENVLKRRFNQ